MNFSGAKTSSAIWNGHTYFRAAYLRLILMTTDSEAR